MKRWCVHIHCLVVSLLIYTNSAVSAQEYEGTGVAGRFGTLGWGLEVMQSLHENVNLRFGLNRYSGDHDGTEDHLDYTIDMNLQSVGLLVDWHPYDGVFRVTGGMLYNGNEVDFVVTPTESLRIGDTSYSPSAIGILTYHATFRKLAPYMGFGFGNALKKTQALGFVLDFGIVFHGSPELELSADGWDASLPGFQDDLAQEKQEIEEDLRPFRYYPVVAFGFTYRFR